MSDVLINFEKEELEGLVAAGTYLSDAAKRFGVKLECDCLDEEIETSGSCSVIIKKGKGLLTSPTAMELELLTDSARKKGERLACQTKIEKSGELTIMTVNKNGVEEETIVEEEISQEEYKKQFEDLPLEKKFSNLVELEAIALSETFSYVVNSPYDAVGKVMDVLAGFGMKMDKDDQEAKRPVEHSEKEKKTADSKKKESKKAESRSTKAKSTATAKKRTASKTTSGKKTAAKKTSKTKATNTKQSSTKKKENDE